MNYGDIIKKSVLEGFSYADFPTAKIMVTLGITFFLAVYLFFVYRMVAGNTFYDRDFNITAAMVSVVTAGIVIAMQSNFVISLGMVGAVPYCRKGPEGFAVSVLVHRNGDCLRRRAL